MDVATFTARFERSFPGNRASRPAPLYANRLLRGFFDPCPRVTGMTSIRKQRLLQLACACLGEHECYLEIGTYQGKSLISALLGNPRGVAVACDNFSEFTKTNSLAALERNLRQYGVRERVTFYDADFRTILDPTRIPLPVGLYFYDGAHDEESQYIAVRQAEPLLADEALVLVDDWRYAEDSQSYAKNGTERAIAESANAWRLLYELPARFNGDRALWWNGVGVLSFRRVTPAAAAQPGRSR
jgi:predicted O-methyltransferase YrrM